MKDLINIFLMAVVVLGWALLEVTGWGYAVLAIPVVYWLKPVLDLLHKNYWVGLAFWGAGGLVYLAGSSYWRDVLWLARCTKERGYGQCSQKEKLNPACFQWL